MSDDVRDVRRLIAAIDEAITEINTARLAMTRVAGFMTEMRRSAGDSLDAAKRAAKEETP